MKPMMMEDRERIERRGDGKSKVKVRKKNEMVGKAEIEKLELTSPCDC